MKIKIPPPDVPAIDLVTGRWTRDYYDIMKGIEKLGLLDLFDVSGAPTNGQVLVFNATTGKFAPGAN